jgi:1-deoxy-D-xylulose-5-phosphate reductoisomerase
LKKVVVLGCTGSIGEQALDVISRYPHAFAVVGMSALGVQVQRIIELARTFRPRVFYIAYEDAAVQIRKQLEELSIQVTTGKQAHLDLASGKAVPVDMVLSALSGTAGIEPTFAAVDAGLDIALSNKETLVTAGELVMTRARESGSSIYPVDSEHSALQQCLNGIQPGELEKMILTCSGGPFLHHPKSSQPSLKPSDALAHPTWNMGRKITIDSATLMNKGLEVIEARWLFDIAPESIDVVIHPESIIHSMIETRSGSVMAQMSLPNMRLPILYALTGGKHLTLDIPRLDLAALGSLTFMSPDLERFPCLGLAYDALKTGGTLPAVMNASNEVAVEAFLSSEISFDQIPVIVKTVMDLHQPESVRSLDQVLKMDRWSKDTARKLICDE